VSPFAEGLVRRAIPMSLPRGPFAQGASLQSAAVRLLDALGVTRGDWDALGAIPTKTVIDVAREVGGGAPMFLIDGVVLPDEPTKLIAQGKASDVDVLTGCSLEEARGAMFGGGGLTERQPNRANPDSVRRDIAAWFEGTGFSLEELLRTYGSSRPGASELDLLAAIATDHFRMASIRLAEGQLAHHDRVWMYRFSWRTPVHGGVFGAYHWLDTGFAFDILDERKDVVGDAPPYEVARAFHCAFVRFATTGDPAGGDLPPWPAYEAARRPVMEFDTTCRLLDDPEPAERRLWEKAHLWSR
jgi:para-nitrobenzyl esterase